VLLGNYESSGDVVEEDQGEKEEEFGEAFFQEKLERGHPEQEDCSEDLFRVHMRSEG
jgi:hypothetical protein